MLTQVRGGLVTEMSGVDLLAKGQKADSLAKLLCFLAHWRARG
ncbi:hypothetical protein [Nocardia rhamnosiphila]